MTTLHNRLRRAGLRACPPCDGNCIQGRDCPAGNGIFRALDNDAHLTERSLRIDNADLRMQNKCLRRSLNWSIAALAAAVVLLAVTLPIPW